MSLKPNNSRRIRTFRSHPGAFGVFRVLLHSGEVGLYGGVWCAVWAVCLAASLVPNGGLWAEGETEDDEIDVKLEALVERFEDERDLDAFQRGDTIIEIGKISSDESVEFLRELYETEDDLYVYFPVTTALQQIVFRRADSVLEAVSALLLTGLPAAINARASTVNDGSVNKLATDLEPEKERLLALFSDTFEGRELGSVSRGQGLPPQAAGWFVKNAFKVPGVRKRPKLHDLLLRAVARQPTANRVNVLTREIRKSKSPDVQVEVLSSLVDAEGKRPNKKIARLGKPFLRAKNIRLRRVAYEVIYEYGGKRFRSEFLKGLKNRDWMLRAICVDALAKSEEKTLVKRLTPLLDDPDLRVQIGVVDAFLHRGGPEVIEPLYKTLDTTKFERTKADIADALARLIKRDFGISSLQWESWWLTNKDKLSRGDLQAISIEELAQVQATAREQSTALYYGLRVLGHVAFVIDCSKSMLNRYEPAQSKGKKKYSKKRKSKSRTTKVKKGKGKGGAKEEQGGEKRIDVARKELRKVFEGLQDGIPFNIVGFNTETHDFLGSAPKKRDRLIELRPSVRQEAGKFIESLKPEGATNVAKALRDAIKYEDVDTVFFLSDGAPTVGITDQKELLRDVHGWNRWRKIKINVIGFGLQPNERSLMVALAAENYGVYLDR
mgnify:CR=1 FL=1